MDPTWGKKRPGDCTGRPAADSRRWKQLCVIVPCVDYAQAVVQTLAVGPSHTIFNVVDDEPVRYRDLFDYIATLDAPEPRDAGPPICLPSFRVSNQRSRITLAWRPAYATHRSGWTSGGYRYRSLDGQLRPEMRGFVHRKPVPESPQNSPEPVPSNLAVRPELFHDLVEPNVGRLQRLIECFETSRTHAGFLRPR
jgi:hypothetical protein